MSAISVDLTTIHARTATLTFTVGSLGASGLAAFNDIRFTAKRDESDPDTSAVISKTLVSGITITTQGNASTAGVLSVALTPADTAALPSGYTVVLSYDVSLYDAAGDAYTTHQGNLTVTPTATLATS